MSEAVTGQASGGAAVAGGSEGGAAVAGGSEGGAAVAGGAEGGAAVSVSRVNPPELARPSGFSHAVVTSGGRTVHLAGQTALDESGRIVGDGVVAQFEQAFGNLLAALRAAGGGPEHLVKLTVYIVDMEDYKAHASEIGAVWRRLAGRTYPAMAGIGVSRLWDAEALVEVEGIAVVP